MEKLLKFFLSITICSLLFGASLNAQISFTTNNTALNDISGFGYKDCVVDMNGDYLDDVVRITTDSILYIDYQQTDGTFVQEAFLISLKGKPEWSICAGDIDGNGYNDLLLGSATDVSFVYANETGTDYYEDFKSEAIFAQRTTFADIDNDGHLDAFVCHDLAQSHPYRNDGNGLLTLDQTLINTNNAPGNYAAIWCDYDNDYDIDLYVSKCLEGSTPGDSVIMNTMYRNDGNGNYTEVAAEINMADADQSWATAFDDFDNDGDFDAFTINHAVANRLMVNNNGVFENEIIGSGIPENDLGAFEVISADFDNDGFIDIFSQLNNALHLNNGDLTFTSIDLPYDDGGIGDVNNDGFLDVVNGNILMINDGNDNNWVKINTEGFVSNKNGIGARVEIYGEWGVQVREVRAGQSFSPMHSLTVHFGLGQATSIDQLIVHWPSGILTAKKKPQINTTHYMPELDYLLSTIDSPAKKTELEAIFNSLQISPNPASGHTYLTFEAIKATNARVQLLDMHGREVGASHALNVCAGDNKILLELDECTAGAYVVRLEVDGHTTSRMIVVH